MKTPFNLCSGLLFFLVLTPTTSHGGLIDWGGNWDQTTRTGSYLVDGVTIELSVPTATTLGTQVTVLDFLRLQKPNGSDMTYFMTFSDPVRFSLPISHLNSPNESISFSLAPSSAVHGGPHFMDGNVLKTTGTGIHATSTLVWNNITSLSFDHIFATRASLDIHDATIGDPILSSTTTPEPSSLALACIAMGMASVYRVRRKRSVKDRENSPS